jgi:hypothetical protein
LIALMVFHTMSTPFPLSPEQSSAPPAARRRIAWPAWLREPLLHFVALGALLFALDHAIVSRSDDPRVIMVGAQVDAEARSLFRGSRGREPTREELEALRRVWLDNEVLYREGLALQVDKGDSAIRERVIFKALSVVDASVKAPPKDEASLRAWFEAHHEKYDEPARYDFEEAVLAGEAGEAAVRAFVARLNEGAPGDVNAGLRVFKGRPQINIVESYGAEFAKALAGAAPGPWRALPSSGGWRAIRLQATMQPQAARFEAVRGVVMQDYVDARMAEQRTAAVRALAKKYTVTFEGVAR